MAKPSRKLVDLSILTIIKFFLVLIFLGFIYFTRQVWLILFVSLILAAALSPAVDYFSRFRVPRTVSVFFFFAALVAFIILIVTLIIPPIKEQGAQFANNLPEYTAKFNQVIQQFKDSYLAFGEMDGFSQAMDAIKAGMSSQAGSLVDTISSFFGGLISFIVMLVITFYLLAQKDSLGRLTKFVLPEKYDAWFTQLIQKIQTQIVNWLKGQLVLSFLIGVFVYIGLTILGVEYALILALIAFVGEFIPYLGPVIAAIPAVFIAFMASPVLGLFVLILFIVIQQAENHILVPKIMQRAVGLNPVISIIALLIGAKVGLVGVVLAIPVATALMVIIKELYSEKSIESESVS